MVEEIPIISVEPQPLPKKRINWFLWIVGFLIGIGIALVIIYFYV